MYANTGSTHLNKLETLNNKLLRILQNKSYNYPTRDLYVEYNTLSIPDLHKYQILLLVHKFMYHKYRLPSVFSNYFELNKNVLSHDTRRRKDLYVTAINKHFGKRCIKHKASTLWNQLPEVSKDHLSVRNFTRRLKVFLQSTSIS